MTEPDRFPPQIHNLHSTALSNVFKEESASLVLLEKRTDDLKLDILAPEFYHKLGFETFAILEDHPRGHQHDYLWKRLG